MPFAATLGIELDAAAAGRYGVIWPGQPEVHDQGLMHGGALMGLADSLGGLCAYLNLPPGAQTATISSTVFLRGVPTAWSPRCRGRCTPDGPSSWCRPTDDAAGSRPR